MNGAAPEYRTCPLTGRQVVVAPERAARPMTLDHAAPHSRHNRDVDGRPECPFCEGMEHDTPGEIAAVRAPGSLPNGPGWTLRVVPNKFPAVRPTLEPGGGLRSPGFGVHELILETGRHTSNPTEQTLAEFTTVLTAYRDRLNAVHAMPGVETVTVFKNVGAESGASLAHSHSQVVGLPFVPGELSTELFFAADYHARTGAALLLDRLAIDRAEGRLIAETPHFAAVTAFAPRFAYEFVVLPKAAQAYFPEVARFDELGTLMQRVLAALDAVLHKPAYNWFLHTAPASAPAPGFVWHFEVLPRTSRFAGFEWATGCYIVTRTPEAAATELRGALLP